MSRLRRLLGQLLRISPAVVILILLVNEGRFVLFGPFGYPQRPPLPNSGEVRRQLDVRLASEDEFVAFIREHPENLPFSFIVDGRGRTRLDDYKSVPLAGGDTEKIAVAPVNWDRVRAAVQVRWNGSLLFPQQIYSLSYNPVMCNGMHLEISQSGAASDWGSCGK